MQLKYERPVNLILPTIALNDVVIPDEVKSQIKRLSDRIKKEMSNPEKGLSVLRSIFYFMGPPGNSQRETTEAFCNELGLFVLEVDFDLLINSDEPFDFIFKMILREALFQRAVVYLRGFDPILEDEEKVRKKERALIKEIENFNTN